MKLKNKLRRILSNGLALFRYTKISSQLKTDSNIYFFFNSWEFGGAERVHLSILQALKEENTTCFITNKSNNDGFREEFEKATHIINLGRWSEKKAYAKHMHKKIASILNAKKNPVIIGCNSPFMYELIPKLGAHVKVIDIIHNFSDGKIGSEWFSLPYVPKITKRVILGKVLLHKFRELYSQNGISASYLDRINIIPNAVNVGASAAAKNFEGPLKIIFVARNSVEKRAEIFLKIAALFSEKQQPISFTMIGDFEAFKAQAPANVIFTGPIYDQAALKIFYEKSHILILCSAREGMPLVVFEAMSEGVVPICTNVGELFEYISTVQKNGFLIDNTYEEDIIANFIEKITLLNTDRSMLREYSNNAFLTVKEQLSTRKFSEAYRKLILE